MHSEIDHGSHGNLPQEPRRGPRPESQPGASADLLPEAGTPSPALPPPAVPSPDATRPQEGSVFYRGHSLSTTAP